MVETKPGILLDCSPDGRWLVRIGSGEFVLTATDGTDERVVANSSAYATRAGNSAQFGEQGKRLYLLGLDRRTIDVLDVDTGRKQRTITFDIPPEDQNPSRRGAGPNRPVVLIEGRYPSRKGSTILTPAFSKSVRLRVTTTRR